MGTPDKNIKKYAETMPYLLDQAKTTNEQIASTMNDFEDMVKWRGDPDEVRAGFRRICESSNRTLELVRKVYDYLNSASQSIKQAELFSIEEKNGLHRKEALNINSRLLHKAPKLTPRIGYDEAMSRLCRLRPKDDDSSKITIRQIAYCLGQVGSESHIVEFWTVAISDDKEHSPIKTNGILNILSPDGTVFWFQAREFIKKLYENYYVGLIKGDIVAVSNRKIGKVVRFLR